ncbi:MAG: hypothetical protein ABR564_08355 [Candidatus Dormibacteria bacterium]
MTAGGVRRRRRRGALVAVATCALISAATSAVVAPAYASSCPAGLCLSTQTPADAAAQAPTPSPGGSLLGIQLPPCLICVSPPLPLAVCGVTSDCHQSPPPAAASPRQASTPRSSAGAGSGPAVVPAAGLNLVDPALGAVVIPRTGTPPSAGQFVAGTEPLLRLGPPSVAQLSPVSGLTFGGALRLWPLLVLLDAVALAGLILVLRRTWSPAPAS